MKKIMTLLLALILLMALPICLAEENSEDSVDDEIILISTNEVSDEDADNEADDVADEETMNEVQVMAQSNLGAEVRIMQLQSASLKSIIAGEAVINILSEKGEDVNELEAIYAELELLHEQIMDMTSENSDVDDFVATKKDLRNLVQEFRTIANPLLTADERAEVKATIDASVELEEIKVTIKARIRELNAVRVQTMLGKMGVENEELITNIEDGNSTPQEIREALKNAYQNLGEEQQAQAKIKIRAKIEAQIAQREKIKQQVVENFVEKQQELLQKRFANADANVQAQIQARINSKEEALQIQEQLLEQALNRLKANEQLIIQQQVNNKIKQKIAANGTANTGDSQ